MAVAEAIPISRRFTFALQAAERETARKRRCRLQVKQTGIWLEIRHPGCLGRAPIPILRHGSIRHRGGQPSRRRRSGQKRVLTQPANILWHPLRRGDTTVRLNRLEFELSLTNQVRAGEEPTARIPDLLVYEKPPGLPI